MKRRGIPGNVIGLLRRNVKALVRLMVRYRSSLRIRVVSRSYLCDDSYWYDPFHVEPFYA